jgi:hypothetical protein
MMKPAVLYILLSLLFWSRVALFVDPTYSYLVVSLIQVSETLIPIMYVNIIFRLYIIFVYFAAQIYIVSTTSVMEPFL